MGFSCYAHKQPLLPILGMNVFLEPNLAWRPLSNTTALLTLKSTVTCISIALSGVSGRVPCCMSATLDDLMLPRLSSSSKPGLNRVELSTLLSK